MHILVGTDADHVLDDIAAALGGPDVSFTVCRNGRDVSGVVKQRTPDLVVLDLQIGSMGGMAVTMALRLDESAGTLPHVPVLMLLDRQADIHLAKRCAADGYLVKPLNPLTLKRTARAILTPPAEEASATTATAGWQTAEEVPTAVG
ncbi:MAG: response regulator [Ilumatobacteraceae bacterium]